MIEMNEIRQMSDKDLAERIVVEREALSEVTIQPHYFGA